MLIRRIADLIFPYRCLGCGVFLERGYICSACFQNVSLRFRLECIGCRQSSPGGFTCSSCKAECAISRFFVVSDYRHPVVHAAIHGLKYKFLPELAVPLGDWAVTYIRNQSALHRVSFAGERFLLTGVPLHSRRENWRGFNQSELVAQRIAAQLQMDFCPLLERSVHASPQARVPDRAERFKNVRGQFRCAAASGAGRNVLIVDDVCTTGATLNECAAVLKAAGAASVSALVIARG
ncbi:MAG TPA: phosphoribosyltransferase family protein [Candidatus Paceibacterota bacterium]|nr:phosphoribosyltransferase family protein [Candidatus Paceibacterota bacterium]